MGAPETILGRLERDFRYLKARNCSSKANNFWEARPTTGRSTKPSRLPCTMQRRAGREIEVRMDSKLVVEQILGNWKIKEPTLKPQVAKVRALLADFPKHHFVHVPRENNAEADRLVNEAIDEAV